MGLKNYVNRRNDLFGECMLVGELIKELEKFPENMEVMDAGYMEIESVYEGTWIHTNYPYDKPDKQVVIID